MDGKMSRNIPTIDKVFVVFKKKCFDNCDKSRSCASHQIIFDIITEFKAFLKKEYGYEGKITEVDGNDDETLIQLNIPQLIVQDGEMTFIKSIAYGVIQCTNGYVAVFQSIMPSKNAKALMDHLLSKYKYGKVIDEERDDDDY